MASRHRVGNPRRAGRLPQAAKKAFRRAWPPPVGLSAIVGQGRTLFMECFVRLFPQLLPIGASGYRGAAGSAATISGWVVGWSAPPWFSTVTATAAVDATSTVPG